MMNVQLHVSNLPYKATEGELRALFAAHGAVTDIHLPRDPGTGRPRGFAFVTMGSAEAAQAVMDGLNGRDLDGRALAITPAHEREERCSFGGRRGSRRRHSTST